MSDFQNNTESTNETIDFVKLKSILRRRIWWILLIFLITNVSAYLYIRYTKPLYESYSDIKLDIKSEASGLGITNITENSNLNTVSSEIELINSRLFFKLVVDEIDIDVQYFTYGNILDDEKYKHSPFLVKYEITNPGFYNRPFDIKLINKETYTLNYIGSGENTEKTYSFNEKVDLDGFSFMLSTTNYYSQSITDENFYFIIRNKESLIDYLENNITVEPLNFNANTIRVTFKDYNRYKAQDLVRAIDTLYLTYTFNQKNLANENKIVYLNSQLNETERILENYEDYFENFTIDNRTVDLDADVANTIQIMNELDSSRFNLKLRIDHVEDLLEKIITENLEDINIKRSYVPTYLVTQLEQLHELNFEKEQLLLAYNENTYTYQRKNQEVDLMRGDLVSELNQHKLQLYENLNELNKRRKELDNRLLQLPSKGTEYNKTKRYYSLYEEMYLSLMKSKNEFELARAGTTQNFQILTPATLPATPISPNKLIVYGVGAISGFVISFLFIGISYLLNDKISSSSEIENLTSIPILNSVPYFKKRDYGEQMVVDKLPKSVVSESFRSLRTNLDFMMPVEFKQNSKVVSVTSSVSGEGKTFVSVNLAGVISLSGRKTVIVDLDLRRPKAHRAFKIENDEKGVSTLLIKKYTMDECIKETGKENLHLITAGPIPPNPSELLLSSEFDVLLDELKKRYDVILLDTPPIGMVTDGLIVMKKAQLKLYIVRADYSKRSYLKIVKQVHEQNKIQHLAIIFNAAKPYHGDYSYGYSYKNSYYVNEEKNGSFVSKIKKMI